MSFIYTMKQWERDGEFRARPGQEINEELYEYMLCEPAPLRLPKSAKWTAVTQLGVDITAGFLMGQPIGTDEGGNKTYYAFGTNERGKYYYLGNMPSISEPKADRDLSENIELFNKVFEGKREATLYAAELCELVVMAKKANANRKDSVIDAIMLTWAAAFLEGYRYAKKDTRKGALQ